MVLVTTVSILIYIFSGLIVIELASSLTLAYQVQQRFIWRKQREEEERKKLKEQKSSQATSSSRPQPQRQYDLPLASSSPPSSSPTLSVACKSSESAMTSGLSDSSIDSMASTCSQDSPPSVIDQSTASYSQSTRSLHPSLAPVQENIPDPEQLQEQPEASENTSEIIPEKTRRESQEESEEQWTTNSKPL